MKGRILFPVLMLVTVFLQGCSSKPENEVKNEVRTELRTYAGEFSKSLKSILMKEIQTSGLAPAVAVCSDTAQELTRQFGSSKGIHIKRVSFKNRNSANVPDEFEERALKYFGGLHKEGKLDEKAEFIEVVEAEGKKRVRFAKPIIIQAPCLNCHGSADAIIPEVKAVLSEKYPGDKATGYHLNDLRGAISVSREL